MTALVPDEGPLEQLRNAIQILKDVERIADRQHWDPLPPPAMVVEMLNAALGARGRVETALAQLEAKPPAAGIPMAEEPGWSALRDDENGRGLTRAGGFLEPVSRDKYQRMVNAWRRGYYHYLQRRLTVDNPYLNEAYESNLKRSWKEGWSACKADLTRGHQPVDLQERCAAWGVLE